MSARSILIYPANLAPFEANWIFGRPKRPFKIKYEPAPHILRCLNRIWNFTPIISFSSLRIFYVKMATYEGGGCLHILNCDGTNMFILSTSGNCRHPNQSSPHVPCNPGTATMFSWDGLEQLATLCRPIFSNQNTFSLKPRWIFEMNRAQINWKKII